MKCLLLAPAPLLLVGGVLLAAWREPLGVAVFVAGFLFLALPRQFPARRTQRRIRGRVKAGGYPDNGEITASPQGAQGGAWPVMLGDTEIGRAATVREAVEALQAAGHEPEELPLLEPGPGGALRWWC